MKPYSDLARIIHKEGYIFITIFAAVTFVLGSFSSSLAWIGGICTVWCAYFFRNPVGDFETTPAVLLLKASEIPQMKKKIASLH